MVTTILKTTEIDLIWFMVYLGMFVGVFTVGLLIYAMYIDLKRNNK